MPLETATYINQLNSANPAHSDLLSQDDSHARLIKATLLATFPNFTAAPLTSTQAAIDAGTAIDTAGVAVLADAGAHFKTNTTDGVTNPAAGEVDVVAANVARLKVTATAVTAPSGTAFVGAGTMPIGGSMPWFTDTLPDVTAYGTYAWLNGQAISRTGANAAIFALLGTVYGAGDGTTTFNLPDTRDNVLVGKGTMGATSAIGRITQYATNALGTLFGECLHLLGLTEVPAHSHTLHETAHTHNVPGYVMSSLSGSYVGGGGGNIGPSGTSLNEATTSATTGITMDPAGGGATHNNVQPSLVCNWVMRIA